MSKQATRRSYSFKNKSKFYIALYIYTYLSNNIKEHDTRSKLVRPNRFSHRKGKARTKKNYLKYKTYSN